MHVFMMPLMSNQVFAKIMDSIIPTGLEYWERDEWGHY